MNRTMQCLIALTCILMTLACSTSAAVTPTSAPPTAAPTNTSPAPTETVAPTVAPPTAAPTNTPPAATATATSTSPAVKPALVATVALTSVISLKPDLYISEFTLSPNPPVADQKVHVRIGVYNKGTAAAGAFKVNWLASTTFVTPPACTWDVASLAAKGGRILECDVVAYQSPYASLTSRAVADVNNTVAESDEGNNSGDLAIKVVTAPAPAAKPDLYISEFTLSPNPPVADQKVHVRIGVYNKGTAAAGAFKVNWLASTTFVTPPACTWDVASLAAKGGRILECDVVAYQSPYANLTSRAVADVNNTVAESDEGNNSGDLAIKVVTAPAPKPDLYVSEFQLTPNPPDHTKSVHVRIGVYNKGTAAAGAFKVEWWAGSNYPAPACTWTVDSLAAKGGRILECDKAAGTWASGYAKITTQVKVDTGNTVSESDESNNVNGVEIAVK